MNTMPTYRRGRSYHTPGEKRKGFCDNFVGFVFSVLIVILPPLLMYMTEKNRYQVYTALSETIDREIIELPHKHKMGDVVHGSPSRIYASTYDPGMELRVQDSLVLSRNTEYCQWEEIRRESCDKCSRETRDGGTETYDCNCVTRFDYFKRWRSYRINSMLFDQPAAHHNPQRDPLPRSTFVSDDAVVEFSADMFSSPFSSSSHPLVTKAQLSPSMLQNGIRGSSSRVINWIRGGIPPIPSFWTRWIPDKSRYEDLNSLDHSKYESGFVYVGDGYFFSPFKASQYENVFKYFMQYVEGSIFDWQLGDLMPSCTAGDIRIRYTVQDPTDISILGEAASATSKKSSAKEAKASQLKIQPIQTSNGHAIGLVHQGLNTAEEMIIAADHDSYIKILIFRVLLVLWSVGISRFLGSKSIFSVDISKAKIPTQIALALSIWSSLIGPIWLRTWGKHLEGFIVSIAAVAFALIAYEFPPPPLQPEVYKNKKY